MTLNHKLVGKYIWGCDSIGRVPALHAEKLSVRVRSSPVYKNKLMKARIERDKKRRDLTAKYENKRAALKKGIC